MKKTLLTLFGAFVISASALAATVNVASDGTVWLDKPQPVVSKVEVAFDEGVLDLGDSWKQAFAQKGTVVPVEAHFESRRDGLFYVEKTPVTDVGVVYDGTHMSIVRGVVGVREASLTPYVILWLLSMVLMSVGVRKMMCNRKSSSNFFLITTFVAFATAAFAAFLASLSLITAVAAIIAFISSVTAFASVADGGKKTHYVSVASYYVFMAASMAAFLFA